MRTASTFPLRALAHSRAVVVFTADHNGLDHPIAPTEARRLAAELLAAADEADAFAAVIADTRSNIVLEGLRNERAYVARRIAALKESEAEISARIASAGSGVM